MNASTAVVGALRGVLVLETSDWTPAVNRARGDLTGLRSGFEQIGRTMDDLSSKARNLGAGLTAGLTLPLGALAAASNKTASGFEASMKRVEAALQGVTGKELKQLSDQARDLAPKVGKGATEAADGIEALGLAGVSTADILGGALKASLDLAAAGATNLTQQAQIRQELYAKINDDLSAEAASRLALTVLVGTVDARLTTEQLVRADQFSGLSQSVAAMQVTIGQNTAGLANLQKAILDGDQANAELIQQVTARLNGNGVSIEDKIQAVVEATGKITGMRTVAIDINGNMVGYQLIGSEAGPGTLNLINTDLRMGTGRITYNNGTYMKVQGVGFGKNNDLIEWFGPSMAISECSETNGLVYLKTNGNAYFGGSLSSGTITNAGSTTLASADVFALGPFTSAGRSSRVNLDAQFAAVIGSGTLYTGEQYANPPEPDPFTGSRQTWRQTLAATRSGGNAVGTVALLPPIVEDFASYSIYQSVGTVNVNGEVSQRYQWLHRVGGATSRQTSLVLGSGDSTITLTRSSLINLANGSSPRAQVTSQQLQIRVVEQ